MLLSCDPAKGKWITCNLVYQGAVLKSETLEVPSHIKKNETFKFCDWSPTAINTGISGKSTFTKKDGTGLGTLAYTRRSGVMLSNQTTIGNVFRISNKKYDKMYAKRAFVHWYVGEGLSMSDFREGREDL